MRKADKRKQLLDGMTDSTKIRWACKGATTYAESDGGLLDYSKPTGFNVERWGFYFKHEKTNEVIWLSSDHLDFLGRKETKPTSQDDQNVAFAYALFKCITHSDGKVYTRERANKSWFIRYSVEAGFTSDEAEALLYNKSEWLKVVDLCRLLASSAGIKDLPSTSISYDIPHSHKMEEVKKVPFAQLILNRISKHKDTRFRDIDGE